MLISCNFNILYIVHNFVYVRMMSIYIDHEMYFVDVGSNNSGFYELQAVLTHKGRSSSSGHYVAWVRRHKGKIYKQNETCLSPFRHLSSLVEVMQ